MYLMNVPPVVAASHTKWRNCGPPQGYSLPLGLISDIELSTKDTPISDKVQMIIESLRSSQSSLDMGDETENNVLPPGQEGPPQACKAGVVPVTGRTYECPTEHRQDDDVSGSEMQDDSDSDDSVDRGIEEAIMEYLKEKGDHKRKAEEPAAEVMQPSKVPRKNPPVPEISEQHSDSNKVLTASNQFPKFVQIETPASPPKKSSSKNKATFKENPHKKTDASKGTPGTASMSVKEQIKSSSSTHSVFKEINVEDDSTESSSSDDGIEEAIQMYQLEKKEQQKPSTEEAFEPLTIKEESDSSSSDDGIEEAIRCYQLEQQKEKSSPKPSLQKPPIIKSSLKPTESTSAESVRKFKSRKKKKQTEKHVKFCLPSPLPSVCTLRNRLVSSPKGKGNGVSSPKAEPFTEEHPPATSMVTTTAELMCAEAILDISKAVMPEVFSHDVGVTSNNPNESSAPLIPSSDLPHDVSDDSSCDSEDGIEQEIRKFLEQKAQMHVVQPPSSAPCTIGAQSVDELVKVNQVTVPKKTLRLSLTQKRKHREAAQKQLSEVTDDNTDDMAGNGSQPLVSTIINPLLFYGLEKTDRSGDKSSSLDSDEDLDTAIKDLLKTKKKLSKRTRDMKLKSKRCFQVEEPASESILQAKGQKDDPIAKGGILKKVKNKLSKKSISQHKQCNKRNEHNIQAIETDNLKGNGGADIPSVVDDQDIVQIKEESSCVDSDDSIELEIRKFLAEKEKAKVSITQKIGDAPRNGNVEACASLQDKDVKLEDQLAEIPVHDGIHLPEESLPTSSPECNASQDKEALPTRETVLLDNSSSALKTVITSCLSSAPLSNSPDLIEPADGAGAARTEKMRASTGSSDDGHNVFSELARPQQRVSPSTLQSRSDSTKWRQCLGLPTAATKSTCLKQSPFHITGELTSLPHQKVSHPRPQTSVWSPARSSTSIVPFHCSPDTSVNAMSRSPFSNPSSSTRQLPVKSFMLGLAPGGHRAQRPLPQTESSMVHMPKDQSVFVELSSNKTNHVQVRSRDTSEGHERRDLTSERNNKERESMEADEKGSQLARREEQFVDETDCESDERGSPEKKQGFSTLCLSSSIDHGISLRPYVALNTVERHKMFDRRCKAQSPIKGIRVSAPGQKRVKGVKRQLQFVPASSRIREGVRL